MSQDVKPRTHGGWEEAGEQSGLGTPRRRKSLASRLEGLSLVLYDVSGYLMSPFFAAAVVPDRVEETLRHGVLMRLVAEALERAAGAARRKRLRAFKFSIEYDAGRGPARVAKDWLLKIVGDAVALHRKGLRRMLDKTPEGLLEVVKNHYVENADAKPLAVVSLDADATGALPEPIHMKVYLYPQDARETRLPRARSGAGEAAETGAEAREGRRELSREEVRELLRRYRIDGAEAVREEGGVRITRFMGHYFAEYRYVFRRAGGELVRELGIAGLGISVKQAQAQLSPTLAAEEALQNIVPRYGEVYPVYRVFKVDKGDEVGYIVVFLLKNFSPS